MAKALKDGKNARREGGKAEPPETTKGMPLNFKVSADFRREFKTFAAQHNKKLNQLLYEAFAALKAKHAE
jgi:hypothetical protein